MRAHRPWAKYWGVYLFLCVFLLGLLNDQLTRLNRPCSRPIEYSLGDIDSRFGLSQAEATDALAQAANLWNSAAKRTLFSISSSSNLPVNFVYSPQQDATKVHQMIGSSITGIRQRAKQLSDELEMLKADYSGKKQSFEVAKNELNFSTSEYNLRIQDLNNSGRASEYDRQQLELQKLDLLRRQQELEGQATLLNRQSNNINILTVEYNNQVMLEHTNVDAINVDTGKEFLAGMYVNRNGTQEIAIYEYSSFGNLVAVLAHELGHALGLGHNDNPNSIMSPSSEQRDTESRVLVLSNDDLGALRAKCDIR
jgi:hypothetical protein